MEAAPHPWPALGVLLVREGLVSKEELEAILDEQRDARLQRITGHQLGAILVARGTVTPTQVARLVAEQYELPFMKLEASDIDLRVARLLSEEITRRLLAVPINTRPDGSYVIAIADPATVLFSDELRRALGSSPHFVVVGPEAIETAIAFVHDRPEGSPTPTESREDEAWQGVVVELRSDESSKTNEFDDDPDFEARTVTHRGPPLGALLLREGLVSQEELDRALTQQSLSTSWRLGEILVDRGIVTPAVVARLIAEQYELQYVELTDLRVDPTVAALLPREIARNFPAVPIASHPDGSLEVAIADPTNVYYTDELQGALGAPLTFVVAAPDQIEALLETVQAPMTVVETARWDEHAEVESVVALDAENPALVDEPGDVSSGRTDLPEFLPELVVVEEPDREAEEQPPTWGTEIEPFDQAFEPSETGPDRDGEIETLGTLPEDLSEALLAEVTEAQDLDELTEREPDAEHEASVTLLELAEEFTDETVDEAPEPETAIATVVEYFEDKTESAELQNEHVSVEAEDPTAVAADLDAAIDEVLALGASAIHFSPQGEWHTVRARIDGLVRELGVVAKEDLESLVERVEASAAMRVSVVSTKQGDKVVLFPREQAGSPRTLADLGLTSEASDVIHAALAAPSGAFVVCGPVGSGTTTTLYAALEAFNTPDRVVASIEDPVERVLDGVDQTEVDATIGVTFVDGLRTLLSTDSDVVFVGEIRDEKTAEVALQAAIDGRHVLSGIRAPSTAAAIRRLMDMGLESSFLGDALTCVVAQRLVRRVCADCRETYYASESELAELGQPSEGGPRLLARGRGCEACDGTGFRGRVGIFEVLSVSDEIRALLGDGVSAKKIHRAAVSAGMQTLRDDGVRLCLEGVTTPAEVQRILGNEL